MKARIMGPNFIPGQKTDLYGKSIQRTNILMVGGRVEAIEDAAAGNICGRGVDQFLAKDRHPLHPSRRRHSEADEVHSLSRPWCVFAEPRNPADLPQAGGGPLRLAKSDPMVRCIDLEESSSTSSPAPASSTSRSA